MLHEIACVAGTMIVQQWKLEPQLIQGQASDGAGAMVGLKPIKV